MSQRRRMCWLKNGPVESGKLLEEAARDGMELTWQHYEEVKRAKMALDNV